MTAFQGQYRWARVYAGALSDNSAVTGLLYSDIAASFLYGGDAVYTPKTLVAADWMELGFGSYFLRFIPADLYKVGSLAFKATNATIRPMIGNFDVDPAPLSFLALPPTCVITGNVVDLAGRSMSDQNQNLLVTFRIAEVPQQTGGSLITSRLITTTPDAYGNFSVALLRGAVVIVEVAPLGLKQEFTVPDQNSATLLSLLPPI